jgi:hypothetical protein
MLGRIQAPRALLLSLRNLLPVKKNFTNGWDIYYSVRASNEQVQKVILTSPVEDLQLGLLQVK